MTAITERTAKTLADITSEDGIFSIVAMEQHNVLARCLLRPASRAPSTSYEDRKRPSPPGAPPYASGILFDPDTAFRPPTEAAALAPTCGLLVASEPAERGVFDGNPERTVIRR